MNTEELFGEFVYGGYPSRKGHELNFTGRLFVSTYLPDADKPSLELLDIIYENVKKDKSLLTDDNIDFIRIIISGIIEKAIIGFKMETIDLGKEKLNEMKDTFHVEFFLLHYLDDWEHDGRITAINDYERYLNPSERENFIECNPGYEEWMATDESEINAELDVLYGEVIDEAWENFLEDHI